MAPRPGIDEKNGNSMDSNCRAVQYLGSNRTGRGEAEFGFLDEFFNLCAEYGMKILLEPERFHRPFGFIISIRDVNIMNNHGDRYPNNVSYSWACMDHPGFLKESERYIRTLVGPIQGTILLWALTKFTMRLVFPLCHCSRAALISTAIAIIQKRPSVGI